MLKQKIQNDTDILTSLLTLFPDCDPEYLRYCISYYEDRHVERVSEKIFSFNHGQYPTITSSACSNRIKAKNAYLHQLAVELFPECDVAFIREKILGYAHSHVQQTCEDLLKMDEKPPGYPRRLKPGIVERWECVRSAAYQREAKHQLYADFPTAWTSTVKAVLAENNHDYVRSYDKLSELSTNSWWTSILNFLRRARPRAIHIPQDLDLLRDIDTIHRRDRDAQSLLDAEAARDCNVREYTRENQLITCGCCYCDHPFEDLAACTDGHLFCLTCLNHLVSEGLFGQGSLRGRPICCMDSDGCCAPFSDDTLRRSLPPDVYRTWTSSLVDEDIKSSSLPVVGCPFCNYCEAVDDPARDPLSRIRVGNAVVLAVFALPVLLSWLASFMRMVHAFDLAVVLVLLPQLFFALIVFSWDWRRESEIAYARVMQKRRGTVFRCLSPECGKVSCLSCGKECKALHKCFEKEQDGLRLYVEKAMVDAVKRTCPKCNLSFQKSDGCNKMTCRCGYTMCYVCRKDIRQESYTHFCEHFRPIPGPCTECKKCDLYKTDPDDEAIRKAAEAAHAEYLSVHPEARHMVGVGIAGDPIIGPLTTQQQARLQVQERIGWFLEGIMDFLLE